MKFLWVGAWTAAATYMLLWGSYALIQLYLQNSANIPLLASILKSQKSLIGPEIGQDLQGYDKIRSDLLAQKNSLCHFAPCLPVTPPLVIY